MVILCQDESRLQYHVKMNPGCDIIYAKMNPDGNIMVRQIQMAISWQDKMNPDGDIMSRS